MADGGIICAQILLTIFNVVQFLCGWLLIIVGAVVKVNSPNAQGGQEGTAIFLIVIGSILVVVALVGCFGAWTKNMCLLVTFCVFTSIGFLLVLIALVLAFTGRANTGKVLEDGLKEMIKWNDTSAFESMQTQFKCCGVNDYNDWTLNPKYNGTRNLPVSCCDGHPPTCNYGDPSIYKKGCKDFLVEAVNYFLVIIGAVTAACAVVLLLAIIAAACMAHSVRTSNYSI